jgi:GGDEF domain-containing protein
MASNRTFRHSEPADAGSARPGDSAAAAKAQRGDDVAFGLRSLEPWVGWAVAAYTALLAMGAPNSEMLWLFAIYAALVGKWAEHVPARQQLSLFGRALALLAGAFVLHSYSGTDPGGRGDVFFVWLVITTTSYAFLLRPGWAWSLLVLGLFTYFLSWLELPPPDAWAVMLGQAGFLCIVTPMLAMRFGAVLRRTHHAVDDQLTDTATGLFNRAGLLQHGEELAQAARRDRQAVTLALFDCASLGAIFELQGRTAGRKARAHWVARLRQLAGDRGLVGRTGATQFAMVVPGAVAAKVLRQIERELGTPARLAVAGLKGAIEPKSLVRDLGATETLAALYDAMEVELLPQGVEQAVRDSEPALEETLLTRIDLESVLSVTEYEGNGFAATDVMHTRPAGA